MRRLDCFLAWETEDSAVEWAVGNKIVNFNPLCSKCKGDT